MNAALYPQNEIASQTAETDINHAVLLSGLLDILDDIANEEQEWWTIRVEPSR